MDAAPLVNVLFLLASGLLSLVLAYYLSRLNRLGMYWVACVVAELIFVGTAIQLDLSVSWISVIIGVPLVTSALIGIWIHKTHQEPQLAVYVGGDQTPTRFTVLGHLSSLKRGDELNVFARTCRRWFLGAEGEAAEVSAAREQALIDAINGGAKVTFVIQDRRVPFTGKDGDESATLIREQDRVVKAYKRLRLRLGDLEDAIDLRHVRQPVDHSYVIKKTGGQFALLILDLDNSFETKPFVAVRDPRLIAEFVKSRQRPTLSDSEFAEDICKTEISEVVGKVTEHLSSRGNAPERFPSHAIRVYLAGERVHAMPPPMSVQLLLTNRCTTKCRMCTHYQLPQQNGLELRRDELHHTLDWIADLGTRSVVLSGGEPLNHTDVKDVLFHAKRTNELNIGILTSGLVDGGKAIEANLAECLKETVAWMQVSIDSFDPLRYKRIRGQDLTECTKSLRTLRDAGVPNVEICYTIQKDNIDEIIRGEAFDFARKYGEGIPVRYKFAHGQGGPFLTSRDKIERAVQQIDRQSGHYISDMLRKGVYTIDGIAKGLPTESRMADFKNRGHRCMALTTTLFINSNGDVYPCCYLFDDNVFKSPYRAKYRLGSLRSETSGHVPGRHDGVENPLAAIWRGGQLQRHRAHTLPVETTACGKCTRHVHQNELMNSIRGILENHEKDGYPAREALARHFESHHRGPLWV